MNTIINKKQALESEKYNHLCLLSCFLQSETFESFFKDIYRPQDDRLRRFRQVVTAPEPEHIRIKRQELVRQVNEFNKECAALGEKQLQPFQDVIKENANLDREWMRRYGSKKTEVFHCIGDETSPKTVYLTSPYDNKYLICKEEKGNKASVYSLQACNNNHESPCYDNLHYVDDFCHAYKIYGFKDKTIHCHPWWVNCQFKLR